MSTPNDKVYSMLGAIPVIIMTTLANVIISFILAGFVFIQLVSVYNCGQKASLMMAILTAVAVHG